MYINFVYNLWSDSILVSLSPKPNFPQHRMYCITSACYHLTSRSTGCIASPARYIRCCRKLGLGDSETSSILTHFSFFNGLINSPLDIFSSFWWWHTIMNTSRLPIVGTSSSAALAPISGIAKLPTWLRALLRVALFPVELYLLAQWYMKSGAALCLNSDDKSLLVPLVATYAKNNPSIFALELNKK